MEATIGWTEKKPWEMLVESSVGKEPDGSDERVDGGEAVGNCLGRAPLGRSDTEATTGWTEGTPWEIELGESSEA